MSERLSRGRAVFVGAIVGCGVLGLAATLPAQAVGDPDPWQLESSLGPDPGPPAGQLGPAVAISSKRCAVGNRRDGDLGTDTGVVHCFDFVRKSWKVSQLLKDPGGCVTCDFGASLSMDSERLAVGAPRDGALGFESGRAHLFLRRGTRWVLDATLARPSPGVEEHFGAAIAVRGRVAVVGAPFADHGGAPPEKVLDAGAAEVYELRDGKWTHAATLSSPKPSVSGWFGCAVAVEGDRIAVGAYGEPQDGSAGAVHLFRRTASGWTIEQSLTPPWSGPSWFGFSIAMEGDRVLVGAPIARPPGSGAATGAAFLHEHAANGFTLVATLTAPWLVAGDGLGFSTALLDGAAFVGATGDDELGEDAGAVYLFARRPNGFRPAEKLAVPALAPGDRCGASLAAVPGRLLIGRGGDPESSPAPGQGAAWIFAQTPASTPRRSATSGRTGEKAPNGPPKEPPPRSRRGTASKEQSRTNDR